MRNTSGFAVILIALSLVFAVGSAAQQRADDVSAASLSKTQPGYTDKSPVAVGPVAAAAVQSVDQNLTLDFPKNATSSRAVFTAGKGPGPNGPGANASPKQGGSHRSHGGDDGGFLPNVSNIDFLDSLASFSSAYINGAGPDLGVKFNYTMVGNHPMLGGTTRIPSQITTVSLRLLNADGTLNVEVPFVFKDLFANSPNFARTDYRSGEELQYADAVHRAQFFNTMKRNWHTILGDPQFVNSVTFTIPRFVNVRFADGSVKAVQAYQVGTAADGNHFVLMLDLLFNFLFDNQVVDDINAGNFTTDALSMTLFPNTFLFSINNQGQPAQCCVLGFHTFFFDPEAIPQPRWVTQFASWISPGLFGAGFQDVTALSHETQEVYGDPFLDNFTALWQFPGVPANSKLCQGNLEQGDPIEVLPNATVPITLKHHGKAFTYHPQIIPLVQWFEMGPSSNAIDGAFSFPDETTLTRSALPCPQ